LGQRSGMKLEQTARRGVQAPKLDGHKPIRSRAFDAYLLFRSRSFS
jgi:hypothetical protein